MAVFFGNTVTPYSRGLPFRVIPAGPAIGATIAQPIMQAIIDSLTRSTNKENPDTFKLDPKAYFPGYSGDDPLGDLFSNPLINWQNLIAKTPAMKGILMNQGIDPTMLPGKVNQFTIPDNQRFSPMQGVGQSNYQNFLQPGGFATSKPNYSYSTKKTPPMFSPGPVWYEDFKNYSQEFKPDLGFKMDPGGFGTSPLANAPNPNQYSAEDLQKLLVGNYVTGI